MTEQRKAKDEKIEYSGQIDQEVEDASRKKSDSVDEILREEKKLKKKKRKIWLIAGGVSAFLGLFFYWGFMPQYAGPTYGLCKIFIELHVQYPETLKFYSYQKTNGEERVWYMYTDAFGQTRFQVLYCGFSKEKDAASGKTSLVLKSAKYDGRRSVDPEELARFSQTIPFLLQTKMELRMPHESDSIQGLKFDVDRFRRRIFR